MATRAEKWQATAGFGCTQRNRLCRWSARAFESLVSQRRQLAWGPAILLEEHFGTLHERTSTRCKAQPTDVYNLVTTYHDRRYRGQLCLSQKSHTRMAALRWSDGFGDLQGLSTARQGRICHPLASKDSIILSAIQCNTLLYTDFQSESQHQCLCLHLHGAPANCQGRPG